MFVARVLILRTEVRGEGMHKGLSKQNGQWCQAEHTCLATLHTPGLQELWHQEHAVLAQGQGRWEAAVQRVWPVLLQERVASPQGPWLPPPQTAEPLRGLWGAGACRGLTQTQNSEALYEAKESGGLAACTRAVAPAHLSGPLLLGALQPQRSDTTCAIHSRGMGTVWDASPCAHSALPMRLHTWWLCRLPMAHRAQPCTCACVFVCPQMLWKEDERLGLGGMGPYAQAAASMHAAPPHPPHFGAPLGGGRGTHSAAGPTGSGPRPGEHVCSSVFLMRL